MSTNKQKSEAQEQQERRSVPLPWEEPMASNFVLLDIHALLEALMGNWTLPEIAKILSAVAVASRCSGVE